MTQHSIFIDDHLNVDIKPIPFSPCDWPSKAAAAWRFRENPAVVNPKYDAEFKRDLNPYFIHPDQA